MTIIEPQAWAHSGGDPRRTKYLTVPEQAGAPSVEQVPTQEPRALALQPGVAERAPAQAATSVRQAAGQRLAAGGLRNVVLYADSVVLAAFFVAGLAFEQWVVSAVAPLVAVLMAARTTSQRRDSSVLAVLPVVKLWTLVMGPACAVVALSGSSAVGRELVFGGLAILAALAALRSLLHVSGVHRQLGLPTGRRCLVVGDEPATISVAGAPGLLPGCDEVVGVLLPDASTAAPGQEPEISVESVLHAALSHQVDQVTIVPGAGLTAPRIRELSWALEDSGIDLAITTDLHGVAAHRVPVTQVGVRLLMRVGSATPRGWTAAAKGALDRLGAAVSLLVLMPVFLGVALAVRVDSPGPAFFRQRRVGKSGDEFTMLKFRTMHVDAEAAMDALRRHNDHGEDAVLFKMRDDPRVTRLGRALRRTSLDELPQLVNVLKGEMSLIGPRPALPAEVARYDNQGRRRLVVKPGMTGLWQVSGRSRLSWQESLRCDLDYVDNWSPRRDTVIAMRTVRAVLNNDGAY